MVEVSIVIPAYNSEKTIEKTLKAVLSQKFPKNKYEIIVVDDGSNDRTRKIVKKFKKIKLLRQKHRGPATARNLGVEKSRGEIILFTDADCIPNKNWIKNMTIPFKNTNTVGVAGTYKTLNKQSLIARFVGYEIEERHERIKRKKYIDFIGTYSAAYRKDIFLKFKGFDDRFSMASGEDPDFSFRISKAGLRIVFQPNAFVFHSHPSNLLKYLKQKYDRAFWKVLLYRKHPKKMFGDVYTPRTLFLQVYFTELGLVSLLLTLIQSWFLYSFLIFIFLSLLLNYRFYFYVWKKEKPVAIISPFIFLLRNIYSIVAIMHGMLYFLISEKFNDKN